MCALLTSLKTVNYRCLADLSLDLGPINVFFGGNGTGKSSILDALWLLHECASQGIEKASANRGQGIGFLWDGASEEVFHFGITTETTLYTLTLGLIDARIDPNPGELLVFRLTGRQAIKRGQGASLASIFDQTEGAYRLVPLREPDRLTLGRYLDLTPNDEAISDLNRLLTNGIQFFHTRSFDFRWLKTKGSDTGHETRLDVQGRNAWAVLRNLHDRRSVDGRFEAIMRHMAAAFPEFKGLLLEQTGPMTVYATFLRRNGKPHPASGASDGHLQLLLLLTALFSEGEGKPGVLLFDEPELSLHPHALAAFAEAVRESTRWGRQVLIATHSPSLLSQFDPAETLTTSLVNGRTVVTRLSDMEDMRELLEEYSTGSLYMAEAVGAQAAPSLNGKG